MLIYVVYFGHKIIQILIINNKLQWSKKTFFKIFSKLPESNFLQHTSDTFYQYRVLNLKGILLTGFFIILVNYSKLTIKQRKTFKANTLVATYLPPI